jgi:hypothetical protein
LIIGGLAYLAYRPTHLMMFHWAQALGAEESIKAIRQASNAGAGVESSTWLISSAPFALWLISYIFAIKSIWGSTNKKKSFRWAMAGIFIAIGSELAQFASVLPGTFDWNDLAALVLAAIIGLAAFSIHATKT